MPAVAAYAVSAVCAAVCTATVMVIAVPKGGRHIFLLRRPSRGAVRAALQCNRRMTFLVRLRAERVVF